jgi:hypothetical protein
MNYVLPIFLSIYSKKLIINLTLSYYQFTMLSKLGINLFVLLLILHILLHFKLDIMKMRKNVK